MSEDEVAQECVIHSGLHRYGHAVEHFARFRSEKHAAHNLVCVGVYHHFKQPFRFAQCAGSWNTCYGQLSDFYIQALAEGFFFV